MHNTLTIAADRSVSVHLYTTDTWAAGEGQGLPGPVAAFAKATGFAAGAGQCVTCPDQNGAMGHVLFGLGDGQDRLAVAGLSSQLPAEDYKLATLPEDWRFGDVAIGWMDGAYRFTRFKGSDYAPPRLLVPEDEDAPALSRIGGAVDLLRDLVNTPAGDMGPREIEAAIETLAGAHGAELTTLRGDDLIAENYPMVHAVGRAAADAPRIMELSWGQAGAPELALVGKGVAFDTGGLNIKTGDYMRLMKKDMGGAAHAIALAGLVMSAELPVRLKLYVPAVENAVAGNAFRPGDVLHTRKGKTVEIDNTDAEGRLILGDALARASESDPDLIIDFATLTGAARVALGPDLAPIYTDDEHIAADTLEGSRRSGDPVWRMPLWAPYLGMLNSSIADLSNSGGRMAGSITAALFLKEFVDAPRWMHLDVWAWREAKYGRPAGAAACGLRAVWDMLQNRYKKDD